MSRDSKSQALVKKKKKNSSYVSWDLQCIRAVMTRAAMRTVADVQCKYMLKLLPDSQIKRGH